MAENKDLIILDDAVLQMINNAREAGKKIGLVQGSWDLYHVGHLRYIEKAKELCDFLIVGIDSDEKIRKRKGPRRPIWPEEERKEMIAKQKYTDCVIVKGAYEPKWGLIKTIKPDVLITIQDNYTAEETIKLEEYCGKVAVLPRQAQKSTSDLIRQMMISDGEASTAIIDERMNDEIEKMKRRNGISEIMPEPLALLFDNLKESTDWIYPVAAGCFLNGKWHFGTNQIDPRLPKNDIEKRTEFFYSTVEQAALNMLKKLGDVGVLNVPVWTTLFPGEPSIKALHNKGVKEIYYLEDHPERNWSKRAHELASRYGMKTVKITDMLGLRVPEETMNESLSFLLENLKKATNLTSPVAAGCYWNGKWYFGTNQIDPRLSKYDIENKTALFYSRIEYAEINLLKKLGSVEVLNAPIWTTLYPCGKSMKVLKDKGVKEIYYLEDQPEQEWSIRSHQLAAKYGITTTQITKDLDVKIEKDIPEAMTPEIKASEVLKTLNETVAEAIVTMKQRTGLSGTLRGPLSPLFENLKKSTDWVCPVTAGCFLNDKWYFGTNQIDKGLPSLDIDKRTELFYATTEHAEINLLMQLGEIETLNVPIWVTLFPCDDCMKVLIDKGIKEVYYLEDHPERNWSKKSHELAEKHGITTMQITQVLDIATDNDIAIAMEKGPFKYIEPRNVRSKKQLDIMMSDEAADRDPFDPEVIRQTILFETDYWYVTINRFPYAEIEYQFLIVSHDPVYKTEDMSKEMWIDLSNIWKKLAVDYNISGGALCYRFGDTYLSGASLKRLHAHIIMPKQDHKTKFNIGCDWDLQKKLGMGNHPQSDKKE